MARVGFIDGCGRLLVADSDREIILMMTEIEWGQTPPVLEWKERVRMRAWAFGFEMVFDDATSFLNAMERHGIGKRVNPDLPPDGIVNRQDKGDFYPNKRP
jgi:hypothetical protein